ncbi:MAG: hypothetical protein Q9219_000896 [cf. Caloplaca sp. 3 TL-2023]
MPARESPSPARRSQLAERSPSTHSLTRASPSPGKGSSTKLHKLHAVSHGRHPHGRNLSHGKNLNRLSKLTAANGQEEHVKSKDRTKSKAQTPSTSPSAANLKQTSSTGNLARVGSKVSMKRNASNLSQRRNKSSSKLGNQSKTDKVQHQSSGTKAANGVRFSVGSDEQDDAWTEADSSQSPDVTRRGSFTKGQAQSKEPLSPDGPPLRSPTQLPDSPPQSPPAPSQDEPDRSSSRPQEREGTLSHPPDAEVVTKRLLSRNTAFNAKPQTSVISATVTPSGSSGSPAFNFSQDATLRNDQSIPSDGISRFLRATGSASINQTPASLSHLNSALAGARRDHEQRRDEQPSSATSGQLTAVDPLDRAQALANPSTSSPSDHKERSNSSRSTSPNAPHPQSTPSAFRAQPRSTPFASARDHHTQSLTQQKLDLQRESTTREPAHAPAVQPPLNSAHASFANLSLANGNEGSLEDRKRKQWDRAQSEYENARRFVGIVGKGLERLGKRGRIGGGPKEGSGNVKGREFERKADKNVIVSMSAESRPESRGRVRFEVGRSHGNESMEADGDSDGGGGGMEGLLRRMWEGDGHSGVDD